MFLHLLQKNYDVNQMTASYALQGHHNERDSASIHQRVDCLLNLLFRHR